MGGRVTADEVRRAGADAPARGAFDERLTDPRVGGEREVVVAAEVEERLPVDDELAPLGARDDAPAPVEVAAAEIGEPVGDGAEAGQAATSTVREGA
jgi:hypothetical protein